MKAIWCAVLLLLLAPIAALAQTDTQKIQNAPWFEREIGDGVTWKYYHFDDLFDSQQDINVITADMNVAGTGFELLTLPLGDRQIVSQLATQYANTAGAINGNFMNITQGSPTLYHPIQFIRKDGVLLVDSPPGAHDEGGVVKDSLGFVSVVLRPGSGDWNDRPEPNVMASNVPLVTGGANYPLPNETFYVGDRHPRTIVGKTADNKVLFVTVDGRRPTAAGMTFVELRTLMAALGASDAQALDGGGSTTMWARGEPFPNNVVNIPSDGSQRLVPNGLAVLSNPSTTTLPWDARFMSVSSYNNTMESGETQSITMTFRNMGTETWGATTTLRTTETRDRVSDFFTSGGWISNASPAALNQASVAPGQNGTFTFTITAPEVTEIENHTESFGMHDSTGGWLGPEQNRLHITVLPEGGLTGSIIIEARAGGHNNNWYDDTIASAFADAPAICTASGLTANLPSRYASTYNSVVGPKRAQFKPTLPGGAYNVYVAWPAGGLRQNNITYVVNHAGGQTTTLINQAAAANYWHHLGQFTFNPGSDGYVEVNNLNVNVSGSFYTAGAMFEPVSNVQEWELY